MIRHRLDKSWLITWTSGLLIILALVISMAFPSIVKALETPPAFRIVDIRAEQGQLVAEVQHFYPNGNHWFYELYTWQGREAYKYPRVTNEAGELLLEDNTVAPYGEPNELGVSSQYIGYSRVYFTRTGPQGSNPTATYKVMYVDNTYGNLQTAYFGLESTKAQVLQYQGQPDVESELVWEYRNGPDWKRHDYPFLDETSILEMVSNTHKTRLASNWTGDRGRTVLPTSQYNLKDQTGAKSLVERFEYLAFTYVESEINTAPPFQQLYNREHTPRTFTIEGQEYSGDTSVLPPIQQYFEIIDLRTQNSKTYQLGDKSRTSVFQKNIHFETDAGNWETSSLRYWKVNDEDVWIMNTHPLYTVIGTPNHISMISPEEDIGARWYTPSVITYEENTAWYEYDGLRWTYSLTSSGIKLTSESLSPRGPKEYSFVFLPLGNANPLRIDDSGNATTAPEYDFGDLGPDGAFFYYDEYGEFYGPQVVVPKAVIIGADGESYLGGDWEIVDDYTIKFAFDDNILPAQAFPYVIDPTTTWTLVQQEDDGTIYCNEGHSSWPLTSSNSGCAVNPYDSQNYSMNDNLGSPNYYYYTSLWRWDTSSLPDDALPITATFSIGIHHTYDENNRNLVLEWYAHDGSMTYADDYSNAREDNALSMAISNILEAQINHFNLIGVNNNTIDVDGYTGLRASIDGGAPPNGTSRNRVRWSYTEDSTFTDPQLTVTYSYTSLYACQATTTTFYPDANPETTSFDGYALHIGSSATWDTLHDGVGNSASDGGPTHYMGLWAYTSSTWDMFARSSLLFDTTSLPDDAVITKSTVGIVLTDKNDQFYDSVNVVTSNPSSDTGSTATDYAAFGSAKLSEDITIASMVTDNFTYTNFNLNSLGRTKINPQGVTKLGLRSTFDIEDAMPVWGSSYNSHIAYASAEETLPGDRRPKLTVTYITPCAALSGTVSDSTSSTFSPANDGATERQSGNQSWSDRVHGVGDSSYTTNADMYAQTTMKNGLTDLWAKLARAGVRFDTTTLPNYSASCTTPTVDYVFYPSFDGDVQQNGIHTWDNMFRVETVGHTATTTLTTTNSPYLNGHSSTSVNDWQTGIRSFIHFDTSVIPDTAIITSAKLGIVVTLVTDYYTDSVVVVEAFTASDTTVNTSDWPNVDLGGRALSTGRTMASLTADSTTYNYFDLNTEGLDSVKVLAGSAGISKFSLLSGFDFRNNPPNSVQDQHSRVNHYMSEESGTSKDPTLTVSWEMPCPGIHSANLALYITSVSQNLTLLNPIQTGYLDGLSIVDASGVGDSLGTSDYQLFSEVDVADSRYLSNIDILSYNTFALNERGIALIDDAGSTKFGMRLTSDVEDFEIPWFTGGNGQHFQVGTVERSSASERPVLTVVHGDSSVAHIDAGHINAGGETIVLTLNGANWRPAGTGAGQFDNTRQDIIDGITGSHGAGADNWNEAVRDNMTVGEVIRTDDDTVTITFAAATYSYAPATTETITATINEGVTDPTLTYEPPASTDNGYVLYQASASSGWPPATCNGYWNGDINSYHSKGGNYNMSTGVVRWNTADLPDDVEVVSAKLRIYVTTVTDNEPTDVNIFGEWYDWDGSLGCGKGGNWPPVSDAFSQPVGETSAGRHLTIPLNNLDEISLTGYTGLRVAIDTAATTDPSTSWYFQGNGGSSAGDDPQLIVTYSRSTDSNVEITSNPVFLVDPIPFSFTSFTPIMSGNSGTLQMTITGVGLPSSALSGSAAVTLTKGVDTINCTGDSDNSPAFTSLVVDCIVNLVAVGDWDVYLNDGIGNDDTHSTKLTLYEPWSSTVNGGSFNDSGSDYAVFAHEDIPYFTVQAFDEVDKEWDASSSPPLILPTAAGQDGQFTSDVDPTFNGKDRLVIGTASATPALFAYEFNPSTGAIGDVSNPSSGAIAMDINDLDIGVGDNIVVVATDGGDYVYMYDIDENAAIALFWTNEITVNPATLPGAECNAVDINANATYVAVGCTTTPFLHVWAINNGGAGTPSWGSKLANPSSLPSGVVNGVKFSPDGTQIAIATDQAPYVEVYEFNGGVIGDKATWTVPITTPTGISYDVDWQKENITGLTNLAVAHTNTPFVSVYPFTTDPAAAGVFGVKLDDPLTLPTGTASSVGFHSHDDAIFIGHASSPYVTAYNFTGISDDDYRVYRYIANFDTSYLPTDAVITSAVLSVFVNTVNVGTDWQFVVQAPSVTTSLPLVVGDYDYLDYLGGSLGFITASGITSSTYNDITLGSYGAIDPDGITQFILRHEEDIGNTAPTVVETVDIAVGDSATFPEDCLTSAPATLRSNSLYNLCNSPNAPRLRVTYTSATGLTTGNPLLADLEVVLLDSHTVNTDGTYTTTVIAKGPIVILDVSTSPTTSVYDFDLNRSIVDSGDPWSFLSSTVGSPFPFMKNFKAYNDDGITQTLWYEMDTEPKADMIDRSGLGHDSSYYSFPTDSTSITSSVGIALPMAGVSVSIGEGAGVPSMADDSSDSNIVMTGTSNTSNEGLPLGGFFDYVEEAGGMPSGIIKLMFAMVVTILAGLIAFKSFQSVAATYIAMLMAIVAFTLGMNGIFEWWMLLTFGLTGGIFIFTRRAYV